jgi:hypothetical protein
LLIFSFENPPFTRKLKEKKMPRLDCPYPNTNFFGIASSNEDLREVGINELLNSSCKQLVS